jgi:hypothetical protein
VYVCMCVYIRVCVYVPVDTVSVNVWGGMYKSGLSGVRARLPVTSRYFF